MVTATQSDLKTTLVVGLEIHVELATRSRMFTSVPNVAHPDFQDAEPNTLCDPVIIGMPGALPVINKRAVEMSMLVGLALNCQIARFTKWDRKSYYYPDLPKNYQISQYDLPLCGEGFLDLPSGQRIRITRAHLEEDAGKLLHEGPGGVAINHSIVDLNRAGTPLLEIVTEPDFRSADDVVTFCNMLRDICRHLGVTEGVMQRGHMRFEPNINLLIERNGQTHKTPIVEIKNLNSFKAVHGAIEHERHRQLDEWLATGVEMQPGTKSTRGWNDAKLVTFMQREKEDAHDYRYFPDPDLAPVVIDDAWRDTIAATMPELPATRRQRYLDTLGLKEKETDQLLDEPAVCRFFDAVLDAGVEAKRAAALLLNYGAKRANEQGCRIDQLGVTAAQVKGIADLLDGNKISSNGADDLFGACVDSDDDPAALAEKLGLLQVSDSGELDGWIDEVLAETKNAKIVEDIKGGKDQAIGALLGQIMKLSKGKANPKLVGDMIKQRLRG